MPGLPVHNTDVTERAWDGPATVAAAPNDPQVLRYMHAWVDANGDPSAKSSYRFPHHAPRVGAPAVLPAVRNALSRLPQSNIPNSDRAAVERHLRAHLEAQED